MLNGAIILPKYCSTPAIVNTSRSCAKCLRYGRWGGSSPALSFCCLERATRGSSVAITLVILVRADGVLIFKFDALPASDLNSNDMTTVNAENLIKIQDRGDPIGAGMLMRNSAPVAFTSDHRDRQWEEITRL
jgi:hypothetical protein